jgi:HEPN domain-containing protein
MRMEGTMDHLGEARRWLEMARADYQAAMAGSDTYSICFHAQQWAEKSAKAVLAFHGARIPHNHEMSRLLSTCQQLEPQLAGLEVWAAVLQPFAVAERYSEVKHRSEESCTDVWAAATAIAHRVSGLLDGHGVRVS